MLYLRVGIGKIEFLAVLFSLRLKTLQKPPFGLIYLNYTLKIQVFETFFSKRLQVTDFCYTFASAFENERNLKQNELSSC